MEPKFISVFKTPKPLFLPGAEIVFSVGQLLKNQQTGEIFCRIRLKNLSSKNIVAVTAEFELSDISGNPLGSQTEQVLDFQASPGSEFFDKNIIRIQQPTCRTFGLRIVQVVFEDRSIWDRGDEEWVEIDEQRPIGEFTGSAELTDEYQRENGVPVSYVPVQKEGFWLCTCGTLNSGHDERCASCSADRKRLFETLNKEALEKGSAQYLEKVRLEEEKRRLEREEEERQREQKREVMKKHQPKLIALAAVVVVIVAFAAYYFAEMKPSGEYAEAQRLMEEQKYDEAADILSRLGDYRDSKEILKSIPELRMKRSVDAEKPGSADSASGESGEASKGESSEEADAAAKGPSAAVVSDLRGYAEKLGTKEKGEYQYHKAYETANGISFDVFLSTAINSYSGKEGAKLAFTMKTKQQRMTYAQSYFPGEKKIIFTIEAYDEKHGPTPATASGTIKPWLYPADDSIEIEMNQFANNEAAVKDTVKAATDKLFQLTPLIFKDLGVPYGLGDFGFDADLWK